MSDLDVQELYRRRAPWYDVTANLYFLVGGRMAKYRRAAVAALAVRPGASVVELGCGTGLNFPLLRAEIGESGSLVGVDLTPEMLAEAEKKIRRHGWSNVTLVREDTTKYRFPSGVDGIISSFMFSIMPTHGDLIRNAAQALRPGGRFVLLDLREPPRWPTWLFKAMIPLVSPFGSSYALFQQRPWEEMARHFRSVTMTEFYGGAVYVAVGQT